MKILLPHPFKERTTSPKQYPTLLSCVPNKDVDVESIIFKPEINRYKNIMKMCFKENPKILTFYHRKLTISCMAVLSIHII